MLTELYKRESPMIGDEKEFYEMLSQVCLVPHLALAHQSRSIARTLRPSIEAFPRWISGASRLEGVRMVDL